MKTRIVKRNIKGLAIVLAASIVVCGIGVFCGFTAFSLLNNVRPLKARLLASSGVSALIIVMWAGIVPKPDHYIHWKEDLKIQKTRFTKSDRDGGKQSNAMVNQESGGLQEGFSENASNSND